MELFRLKNIGRGRYYMSLSMSLRGRVRQILSYHYLHQHTDEHNYVYKLNQTDLKTEVRNVLEMTQSGKQSLIYNELLTFVISKVSISILLIDFCSGKKFRQILSCQWLWVATFSNNNVLQYQCF